jgi:hypothetical protein
MSPHPLIARAAISSSTATMSIFASRLAEDHGYARRRVNDEAPAALWLRRRLGHPGRPVSS